MTYIPRQLETVILDYLNEDVPRGLVLTGLVGAGKTTMIRQICNRLSGRYRIFNFTGDDIQFRLSASMDSRFVLNEVRSQTTERALIFVDEIQKSADILDNLKVALDEGGCSFIVTGSNPAYLRNQAVKRLQRRAIVFDLFPFSLNEIFSARGWVELAGACKLKDLILGDILPEEFLYRSYERELVLEALGEYRHIGTIPFVLTGNTLEDKFRLIGQVINRGLPPIEGIDQNIYDIVLTELAKLNEKEFTYQTILQKTRLKRREKIDRILRYLCENGVLFRRSRIIFEPSRISYHFISTFVDPGIVSYLTGRWNRSMDNGFDIQSFVRIGLENLKNFVPLKIEVGYYKPYYITPSGQVKYKDGEIDFIVSVGDRIIPIEVKSAVSINKIDTSLIASFIRERSLRFGIVFYFGETFWDSVKRILYLPVWVL